MKEMDVKSRQRLDEWRLALVTGIRAGMPELSARQMAVMLTIYLTEGQHTVRGLAKTLNISKPAISRALDSLAQYGFVVRVADDRDRRSVYIRDTTEGAAFIHAFSGLLNEAAAARSSSIKSKQVA